MEVDHEIESLFAQHRDELRQFGTEALEIETPKCLGEFLSRKTQHLVQFGSVAKDSFGPSLDQPTDAGIRVLCTQRT